MLRPLKVVLLGATFDTGNLGVNVLASSTLKILAHSFPGSDVILLNYGGEGDSAPFTSVHENVNVSKLNMRFSRKLFLVNNVLILLALALVIRLIPCESLRQRIISRIPHLEAVQRADLVASIAGGDSFSDIYGLRVFLYVVMPQLIAIFLGKRVVQLPQTFGPYRKVWSRAIARYVLRHSSLIYSRDLTGVHQLRDFLGEGAKETKIRFCYDVGFVLDPKEPSGFNVGAFLPPGRKESVMVGLNISGLLYHDELRAAIRFGIRSDYKHLVATILSDILDRPETMVLLVPHVLGADSESDVEACEQVFQTFHDTFPGRIFRLAEQFSEREIKYLIGICSFFVGARMHACIAAISQTIPTVAIAYSDKFMGVMHSVGLPQIVADARRMDVKEITELIRRAYLNRDRTRAHLIQEMPRITQRILRLFEEIRVSY